jgi:hypothetical protein
MKINHHFGASATPAEVRFVRDVESFFKNEGKVTSVDVVGAVVTVQVTLTHPWSRRFSVSDLNELFSRSHTSFKVEGDKVYCQYTLSKRHHVKVANQDYEGVDLSKNLVLGSNTSGELEFLPINRHKLTLVSGACGTGKTYFLQNAIKKMIYASSSEDLQILLFSIHTDSLSFLNGSRFLYQSKIFKDPKEFVEVVKNLDNDKVLIVAEDLEYFNHYNQNETRDLMKELKEAFDQIENRMILVSQSGRSDSTDFNQLVDSSTFRIVFYLSEIYGSRLTDRLAKTEKLHRTGDAFAIDTIRKTAERIEMITES